MLASIPPTQLRSLAAAILLAAFVLTHPIHAQTQPANSPTSSAAISSVNKAKLAQNYGKLPLSFEANQGQSDPKVKFLSRGNGYAVFLTDRAAVLSLIKSGPNGPSAKTAPGFGTGHDFSPADESSKIEMAPSPASGFVKGHDFSRAEKSHSFGGVLTPEAATDTLEMQLANSNPNAQVSGTNQLPGHANYFLGNDPAKWHTNVPTYARVEYENVYNGIDLVYYGNQRQLEYDFVVAPHADPKTIQLHFAGAQKLKLAPNGDLEVIAKNGQIAFHKPVLYQEKDGQRQPIDGRFTLQANNSVAFAIGQYDLSRALVIDPVLAYSTYLGDSTFLGFSQGTWATAIAVDSSGFAYVTGYVYPNDFPVTPSPFQSVNKEQALGNPTGFVTKLSQDGNSLIYSTYVGGSSYGDQPAAIAVDASGSVFICGITGASDFPVTSDAFLTSNPGLANNQSSPFVTKFSVDGSKLEYSTFLGGSGLQGGLPDVASGIAIDSAGDAYIVGTTYSTDFPVKNPFQSTNLAQPNQNGPGSNAFVSKLNPTGTALVWSTYLGGEGNGSCDGDGASGIAVDSSDHVYVAGVTCSTDFPVAGNPYQPKYIATANLTPEAFITEFEPAGNKLVYSTYLGGTGIPTTGDNLNTGDGATSLAIDGSGDVFVTGQTYSTDFPVTPGAYQGTNKAASPSANPDLGDGRNAFVTELNATGSGLKYSTYLGGSVAETGFGIAIDLDGDAYVFGSSASKNFPVTPKTAFQTSYPESTALTTFLTELNPSGASLVYSTYFGGSGVLAGDLPAGIVLDSDGGIYITGNTGSQAFPTTVGAFQTVNENPGFPAGSAFVSKFYPGTAATLNRATTLQVTVSPTSPAYGTKVTFTAFVSPSSGTGNPTGTVAFSVWGGPPTVVALDNTGHASFSSSTLAPPDATVTASYSGDTIFQGSNALSGVRISGTAPATYLTGAISGSQQISPVGTPFGNPLVVLATAGYAGQPASGVTVTFSGTGLKFSPTSVKTNSSGIASVTATPTLAGNLVATATVTGQLGAAYFDLAGVNSAGSSPTATPILSPAAGTYTSPVTVTVSDGTPSAAIYCTTNGTTPTPSSPKYNGSITVSSTETIECIATATGFTESAVATDRYVIQIPASIAVSSGSGQTAAYGSPFAMQLSAVVKDTKGDLVPAATVTFAGAGFNFSSTTAVTNANGIATVTATPTAIGALTATATVAGVTSPAKFPETATKALLTVTCNSYTVGYGQPIPTLGYDISGYVLGDTGATAITGAPTCATTATKGSQPGTYTITAGLGTLKSTNYSFKLANGTLTVTALGVTVEPAASTTISIAEATSGATVYYTLNNTTPTVNSAVYKGPITVTATTIVKFIAVAPGYSPSPVRTVVVEVE